MDGWVPWLYSSFFTLTSPHPATEHLLGTRCSVRHPQGYREVRTCKCLASGYRGVCEWRSINIHSFYKNQSSKWPMHWLHYQASDPESFVEEIRDALRMNEKAESIKRQIGSMEQEVRERRGSDCEGYGKHSPTHPSPGGTLRCLPSLCQ